MIFEIKLEGGILAIFRSKSQVVPYDEFSKNLENHEKCKKIQFLITPPPLIIFLNDWFCAKDT